METHVSRDSSVGTALGYGLDDWGFRVRGVKLTTHLHLVIRSKSEWGSTFIPQYTFMAWCSVKGTLPLPSWKHIKWEDIQVKVKLSLCLAKHHAM
jgi:hypothetical protein